MSLYLEPLWFLALGIATGVVMAEAVLVLAGDTSGKDTGRLRYSMVALFTVLCGPAIYGLLPWMTGI
jgi:hypothetical protein